MCCAICRHDPWLKVIILFETIVEMVSLKNWGICVAIFKYFLKNRGVCVDKYSLENRYKMLSMSNKYSLKTDIRCL